MNDIPSTIASSESDAKTDARATLLGTLVSVAESVTAQFERVLEPMGMSMAKLKVLRHLDAAGEPLPLGQLADRSACVRSNVTQLIDRMEGYGLVRRVADPDDRRCTRAALTEQGRVYLAKGNAAVADAERAMLARMDVPHAEQIIAALHALQQGE